MYTKHMLTFDSFYDSFSLLEYFWRASWITEACIGVRLMIGCA